MTQYQINQMSNKSSSLSEKQNKTLLYTKVTWSLRNNQDFFMPRPPESGNSELRRFQPRFLCRFPSRSLEIVIYEL